MGDKSVLFPCDRCGEEVPVVQTIDCDVCNLVGVRMVCADCKEQHDLVVETEKMSKYYKGEM